MKICPRCHNHQFGEEFFCEKCGTAMEDVSNEKETPVTTVYTTEEPPQAAVVRPAEEGIIDPMYSEDRKLLIRICLAVLGGIVVCILFFIAVFVEFPLRSGTNVADHKQDTAIRSSDTKNSEEMIASAYGEYADIINAAEKLTAEQNYAESNAKLAEIPAEILAASGYEKVKAAVDKLIAANQKGIDTQNEADAEPVFVGDFEKWNRNYTFYYPQENQTQSSLTLFYDGKVTQINTDGTEITGKASVEYDTNSQLSYDTADDRPAEVPETKNVDAADRITINWDNGGSQILYGYLSYTSRYVLTDGIADGTGVREVWTSY